MEKTPEEKECRKFVGELNGFQPARESEPRRALMSPGQDGDESMPDTEAQGAVVLGDSLLSYVAGVSREEKRNVHRCIRFARHSADKKFAGDSTSGEWFVYFASVLQFLGWAPKEKSVVEVMYSDFSGSVSQAYLNVIRASESPSVKEVTVRTFSALSEDRITLATYARETLEGEKFHIVPVQYNAQGHLELRANHFRLLALSRREDFLFFNWEEEAATLSQHYGRFTLDKNVFSEKKDFLDRRIREIALGTFCALTL
jgi:hypothetical protein